MKVTVLYRACGNETCGSPLNPVRPEWFSKKLCWDSYYKYVGSNPSFETHLVYDGGHDWLSHYISEFDNVKVHRINEKSNEKSLLNCYDLAFSLNVEYVMFQEDDFLFRQGADEIVIEGLEKFALFTLYEHLDRYLVPQSDLTFGKEYVFAGNSCYFRSVESTVCSWLASRALLDAIKPDMYEFKLNDRNFFRHLLTKKIRLFSPMPGFSTHCDKSLLSPYINWKNVVDKFVDEHYYM